MKRHIAVFSLLLASGTGIASSRSIYELRNVAGLLATARGVSSSTQTGRRMYTMRGAASGGFVDPTTLDDGFLQNGQEVLIVPLMSGGSGGVFTTLLFTRSTDAWKLAGFLQSGSGHLSVYLQNGQINAVTPIYAAHDPNCCPSKHHHNMLTLNGARLKVVASFDTP